MASHSHDPDLGQNVCSCVSKPGVGSNTNAAMISRKIRQDELFVQKKCSLTLKMLCKLLVVET